MSADDQQFLDAVSLAIHRSSHKISPSTVLTSPLQLSSIPVHLRRYSNDAADFINVHVDQAADYVRETLSSNPWIPSAVRPAPPPKPPVAVIATSRLEQVQDWIARHKILTGVIVFACGTVIYKGYKRSRYLRKTRRAKKARNGGRTEVVVIAGSAALPLTKSLALDMERRGFIVYVVCNAVEDESTVSALARPDIRPLTIDTTDVCSHCNQKEMRCAAVLTTLISLLVLAPPSNALLCIYNHHRPPRQT